MSNSPLVNYTRLSPNHSNGRNHVIDTITIHCMAGNLTVETCGAVFAPTSRKASSNYGIGSDGRIGLYCEEKNRPWTSSNAVNDNRAITIEVANDGGAPDWHVSQKAMSSLILLVTDICKRNNIKKLKWSDVKSDRVNHVNGCNMTLHRDFANTSCPGPYLISQHPYIAEQVNRKLNADVPDLVVDGYDYANVYNYEFYINKYEDLKKAFGDDQYAAFDHFLKHGMREGRQAKANFIVGIYKDNYIDLRNAFGNDLPKYYRHYIKYGIGEKRVANYHVIPVSKYEGIDYSPVYDGKYYVDKYADLKKAFGNNYDKLIEHFVKYGMKECRQAKSTFNVDIYKSNYEDLRKAFGNDMPKYYMHFIKYGMKEGRIADRTIKPFEYTIYHEGDSIEDIARSYNMSVNKLLELNGIKFKDGQKLRVR